MLVDDRFVRRLRAYDVLLVLRSSYFRLAFRSFLLFFPSVLFCSSYRRIRPSLLFVSASGRPLYSAPATSRDEAGHGAPSA